jgi:hypothetical protein
MADVDSPAGAETTAAIKTEATSSFGPAVHPPGSGDGPRGVDFREHHFTIATGGTGPAFPSRILDVPGHEISIHQLGLPIDVAYDTLYHQALVGSRSIEWSEFNLAVVDLVRTTPTATMMDHFFENATPLWKIFLKAGRHETANDYWSRMLSSVVEAEDAVGTQVHKGSGYYFWACNALERGDVDRGLLLMHEAVVEDSRTQGVAPPAWPNTSATKVVSLDVERMGTHPASWWVAAQVAALNAALKAGGATIRAEEFRTRFLLNIDPASAFLFVHAHASLLELLRMPREHRDNDFVGRLALGHLFHLAIVIERAIKSRSGNTGLFKNQIEELSQRLGGKLKNPVTPNKTYANDINTQQTADPDATLRRLLNGTATYEGSTVVAVDRPLCVSYVLRNVGGHSSAAPRIVSEKLDALCAEMLHALALCVGIFY